ncbi:MAG: NAD(P)-dependent oxidoreductase [Cytophagales bacterium]|uniref:NAD-dependent epimerase/dehydratase family protein n=1 Tax=Cyclobacterium marinum TaxID=104 RepID=UPI0011EEC4FD|nr:NAD(P)-dependent oxidoreductase [Cyclobacterium marinum]MBI0400318.1 NAD(P)-dependent oxidoreductase [Cyclobacterium marinum]MBR9775474.1 NAD(P)-dependent oxidoreductase [Cytophagales bacterium]|tara:strand:+ start:76538 stop:77554 length:1017 start_codon:yes stop_codon:yes gene_type:complete
MKSIEELEEILSKPTAGLIEDLKEIKGDIIILGVAGKMGPSLAKLASRAVKEAGIDKKVIGVSRFSDDSLRIDLENHGVTCIAADLLDDEALQALPEAENVIYMAGKKFGTTGQEHSTWAMNAYLPGRVATKYKNSKIIVFSSGNIYPFVHYASGGALEETPPEPIGEYAQSCLGRERVFEYFSHQFNIPMLMYRLNYAIDMRYGNLLEIGKMVNTEKPIDLRSGHMNVIWQGDANEIAIRSLLHTSSPPKILNVTGPETISIRQVAEKFGKLLNKKPVFVNEPEPNVLLNNASLCHQLFGYPSVSLLTMIEMTVQWIQQDGATLNKPTHFQEREGKF